MKVIGHRGAAGIELENTMASIQKALEFRVYAVEFDVRKTKDGVLVLCHDADLQRVADNPARLSELTFKQLQKVPLLTGSHVPTLDEALDLVGEHLCIIELKENDCGTALIEVLRSHPKAKVIVASFKLHALAEAKVLAPNLTLYALERTKPFDIIHLAKEMNLDGIGFNYWILNPLTYFLCKRAKFDVYVYVVDTKFKAAFMRLFYPDVAICTNYPELFMKRKRR